MRPTASSKRDRHELRLIKKHRRDRDRSKKSSNVDIDHRKEEKSKSKKHRLSDDDDDDDDDGKADVGIASRSKDRHKVKKLEASTNDTRSTRLTNKNGHQAWTADEDAIVLKAILEAGERGVNWSKVLNDVNGQRSTGRTMASVRGHWANVMRANVVKYARSLATPKPSPLSSHTKTITKAHRKSASSNDNDDDQIESDEEDKENDQIAESSNNNFKQSKRRKLDHGCQSPSESD